MVRGGRYKYIKYINIFKHRSNELIKFIFYYFSDRVHRKRSRSRSRSPRRHRRSRSRSRSPRHKIHKST